MGREKQILPGKSFEWCGVGGTNDVYFWNENRPVLSITDLRPSMAPSFAETTCRKPEHRNIWDERNIWICQANLLNVAVSGVLVMCISWNHNLDARGRRATSRETPRGANQCFEKKTGSISPLQTARVQRCVSPKRIKKLNKQIFLKTDDLHLCTLLFLQCINAKNRKFEASGYQGKNDKSDQKGRNNRNAHAKLHAQMGVCQNYVATLRSPSTSTRIRCESFP